MTLALLSAACAGTGGRERQSLVLGDTECSRLRTEKCIDAESGRRLEYCVAGAVGDERGKPVPGVEVLAYAGSKGEKGEYLVSENPIGAGETDQRGEFAFSVWHPDVLVIATQKEGFRPSQQDVERIDRCYALVVRRL